MCNRLSPVPSSDLEFCGVRRSPRGLTLLVLCLGWAGCGTTIDMSAVGKSVSEGIQSQLGLAITSVACPPEARPAKTGDVFECVATPAEGGRLVVTVTQKDDQGNVNWEVTKTEGLLDLQLVEASVREGLKQQAGVETTVSCGQRWKGARPGEVFECRATAPDGQEATVAVTTTDAEGNITWAVR